MTVVESWLGYQCSTCQMLFAIPSLSEGSRIEAMDLLAEELKRHAREAHMPDLPSEWRAQNETQRDFDVSPVLKRCLVRINVGTFQSGV
jgi:hypothetical protein